MSGRMSDRERVGILLEAAWEAVMQLGLTDFTAVEILIPAILRTDYDPEYAREQLTELVRPFD